MHRLVVLPAARDDLLEIGDFIAQDNPQRAASYIDELEQRLTRIAECPRSYPMRDACT